MRFSSRIKPLFANAPDGASLRERAIGAGAWLGIGFAAQKVLQFGSNLILTRLLFPEAFGLMALANVFLIGLALFTDVGIKPSVIRDEHGDDIDFLNTAWSIQVYRGFGLCAAGLLISYPVSVLYHQPTLFPLLSILSLTPLIYGFDSIGFATAERKLNFKNVVITQIISQTLSIIVLVTTCLIWRSVWALAVSNVLGAFTTLILSHIILSEHRHRINFRSAHVKSIVRFGRWILLATISTYLGGEGLRAVQGWLISPSDFGILAVAYAIANIPNELASKIVGSIGLPAIAESYRDDPKNVHTVLMSFRTKTLALSLGLFIAVMIVARPAITTLYDARYADAAHYLIILSFGNAIAAVTTSYNGLLLASGKSERYFFVTVMFAILRVIGISVGFEIGRVIGMLYGLAAANFVYGLFSILTVRDFKVVDLKVDILSICVVSVALIVVTMR